MTGVQTCALPISKTTASRKLIPAFPAKKPAKHTPTAIPSGMLCSVTENNNIFNFLPFGLFSNLSAILFMKSKNITPNNNPTAAGIQDITH